MSLKAWLAKGALRTHKSSSKEIAGLLALADRSLADAGVAALSAEGRFQFAYNAALAMATAALHAEGYRTNTVAVSETEAAEMLALARQLRRDVEAWLRARHAALIILA